jgi:NAD(P)-dependent dehydrogenase (short-subunit alcohol dehydrogenase family)
VLKGRKIVITGAGRGLGAALAIVAADRGMLPLLLGRSRGALEEVARAIEGRTGRSPDAFVCDLADVTSVREAAEQVATVHPDFDIVVNSGSQWVGGPLEKVTDEQLAAIVGSTVTGTIALTRRLLPLLRARPRTSIRWSR